MGWPYEFLSLSAEERHARRLTLDRYASYAQFSALVPVLVLLLCRGALWAATAPKGKRGAYNALPSSPSSKERRQHGYGTWTARLRMLGWWLGDEVHMFGQVWGQRDLWIFGSLWGFWMLFLCVSETGSDYLHLTKRLGAVACSQLPVQYLLALKSLNPFAYVFRSSHEQVNRWHRVLGLIIYVLLCFHGALYMTYFVQNGILFSKLSTLVPALGVAAFIGMSLLSGTALRIVRHFSYRLFFVTHVVVAFAVPPLLFFHARSAGFFAIEAVLVLIADLVSRKLDTVVSQATVESIPGTDLVKVCVSVPDTKIDRFREHPGSHIYLNMPAAALPPRRPTSPAYLVSGLLFNPFTVAGIDEDSGNLTLVARHRNGPTTRALARLAGAVKPDTNSEEGERRTLPLNIEGPYGVATRFPRLASGEFDRVLLVAGGVGATFTVPLYRSIMRENPHAQVKMVWAVRGAGDATWAVSADPAGGTSANAQTPSILDDANVHIFLTGDILGSSAGGGGPANDGTPAVPSVNGDGGDGGDGVELNALYRDRRRNTYTAHHNRRRPDLKKIVDDAFKHGREERVAVLVCGPEAMGRELREHVRAWVMRGRYVWFHNETFGW